MSSKVEGGWRWATNVVRYCNDAIRTSQITEQCRTIDAWVLPIAPLLPETDSKFVFLISFLTFIISVLYLHYLKIQYLFLRQHFTNFHFSKYNFTNFEDRKYSFKQLQENFTFITSHNAQKIFFFNLGNQKRRFTNFNIQERNFTNLKT